MTPNTFLWRLYKFNNVHRNVLCGLCGSFCLLGVLFGALRCWYFFLICFFWKNFLKADFFLKSGLSASVFWTKAFASAFSALNCRRAAFLYGAFLRFCIIIRPVRFPNRKMLSAFCSVLCAASIPVFSCSVSLTFECALFNTVIPAISAAFFTGERWYISDWGLISFSNFRRVLAFFFFSS